TGEAASSRASPISHRLRSRDRSGASMESDTTAEFASPTEQLQKRARPRSDDADEAATTTPTRRSTRSAAAKKSTDDAEAADETPTSRRGRRTSARRTASNTSAEASDDTPTTPTRRTTRSTSRTPAKKSAAKPAADTSASEVVQVSSPRTRRTPRQSRKQTTNEDSAGDGDVEMSEDLATPQMQDVPAAALPPPHPDLSGITSKLAAAAAVLDKAASADGNSVDEGSFHTAPESPEKKLKHLESKADEDISDLSDAEDPHFSDAPDATESVPKATHKKFDSDAESDNDEAPDVVPAKQPLVAADDESDDDAAPEVVSTKKPLAAKVEEVQEDTDQQDETDQEETDQQKPKKKHRRRHRKHAASAAVTDTVATAIEAVRESLNKPALVLPREIPAQLRLTATEPKRTDASAPPKRAAAGQKLDASLLADFAKESGQHTRLSDDAPRKKRKHGSKKRAPEPARKGERFVSGIRVVASAPASRMSLLESLTQEVPKSVKRFSKEKHGGRRVPRSDPLEAIARSHGKPAVAFLRK
ncbi:hypothetical protein EC988_002946, partial [Linderina pennispora]